MHQSTSMYIRIVCRYIWSFDDSMKDKSKYKIIPKMTSIRQINTETIATKTTKSMCKQRKTDKEAQQFV